MVGALEMKRVKGDRNGREKRGGGAKRCLTISVQLAGKGMTDMDKWKALDTLHFRQDCNK